MSLARNICLFLLCCVCLSTYSQEQHYYSLDTVLYSQMQDYRIEYNQEGLGHVRSDLPRFFEYYFTKGPYMPCIQMDFYFPSNAENAIFDEQLVISEFSIDVQKELVSEYILLDNENDAIPVGSQVMENENISYNSKYYPWEQVTTNLIKLLDTKQWCIRLLFFPFYYDAVNYKLFICKSCALHISIDTNSTAIQDVKNENANSHGLYDLSGRRLTAKPTRGGVFIKDGKKVVVK